MNQISAGAESMPMKTDHPNRRLRRLHLSPWQFLAFIQVSDFILAAAFSFNLAKFATPQFLSEDSLFFVLSFALTTTIFVQCLYTVCELYNYDFVKKRGIAAFRAGLGWCFAASPMGMALVASHQPPAPRFELVWFFGASFIAFALLHYVAGYAIWHLERAGVLTTRVAIIGQHDAVAACVARIKDYSVGKKVCAIFPEREWPLEYATAQDRVAQLGQLKIDIIVFAMPLPTPTRLALIVNQFSCLPAQIILAPWISTSGGGAILCGTSGVLGAHLEMITILRCPLQGWKWVLKDVQDRILAGVLLLLALPVFTVIAIGIRFTSPGPVLFRQKRRGYGGTYFDILKFRTMDVQFSKPRVQDLQLTVKNDPRVYPFGRLLRRTSFDELPQLLNVLRGDMWLIGPRPHSPLATVEGADYGSVVSDYAARYRIKPGLTGWAQVNGWRGPTETQEQIAKRVEYDLYYIENWSACLDFIILLKTLFCIWPHKNAF